MYGVEYKELMVSIRGETHLTKHIMDVKAENKFKVISGAIGYLTDRLLCDPNNAVVLTGSMVVAVNKIIENVHIYYDFRIVEGS